MKNRVNQLFHDKLLLVMMVLGLLTIVAAAGAVRIRKGNEELDERPYLEIPESRGIAAREIPQNRTEQSEEGLYENQPAGSPDAFYSAEHKNGQKTEYSQSTEENRPVSGNRARAEFLTLQYNGSRSLLWPVRGNVVLDYSMEQTTYFPTLEQYKCNPALIIQGEVSTPVQAPADALVTAIGTNEEIGNYVVLELGGEYKAICGQLKDIQVSENQYVARETVLGYIGQPTKYYTVEGDNLYFELQHRGKPVDALDYLQ